jgi:hypothetical protein
MSRVRGFGDRVRTSLSPHWGFSVAAFPGACAVGCILTPLLRLRATPILQRIAKYPVLKHTLQALNIQALNAAR